jgi:acetyl-CoA synthetase
MADIGWITGHSYIVYGPLSLCASTVVFEGVPNYPDPGRPWRIAQNLDVNIFHTAPTAIRALRKIGPDEPAKYNYHFKHMTTVGEPIEPEVWKWYYEVVGKGEAAIVDTWWQTETGGFLCSTLPAVAPMKPGSAGPGMPGIHAIIYDDEGNVIPSGAGKAGNICIQNPWPGGFQTIWGDRDRFVDTYYARYCKDPKSKDWRDWPYMTGDAAVEAEDGYYRILGRIDDVINVSGHRLGTKEIESAALISISPLNPAWKRRTSWPKKYRMRFVWKSARLPNRAKSGSSPTCPKPARARSCAGCWARSQTTRTSGM